MNGITVNEVDDGYSLKAPGVGCDVVEKEGKISVFYDNYLQKTIKLYTINKIDVLENQDVFNSIKLQWEK